MKLLTCFSGRATRMFAPVICVLGMAFSAGTLARTCEFSSSTGFDLQDIIPVAGTGVSTIGEDIPVGTTIYTSKKYGNFTLSGSRPTLYCNANELSVFQRKFEVVATPSGAGVTSGGQTVFPTNVPGIGVTFSVFSVYSPYITEFPGIYEYSTYIGMTEDEGGSWGSIFYFVPLRDISFSLVKTGMIDTSAGTQQVLASSFPVFRMSASVTPSENVNERVFTTISFTGAVTFHTKTCQIAVPDINVNLGLHPFSVFKAAGTTTEWKSFDITLQDCPPFYGYGESTTDYGTSTTITAGQTNKVALTFNSVNGVVESNPALASIESGPDAAQGIGIEMTQQDDSTSIPMDGTSGFELQNLTTTDGGTYVIPLRARYVQYESSVKAGVANGAVVFTITYQ